MSDYTPTTAEVRAAASRGIGGDWFDRWLAEHDAALLESVADEITLSDDDVASYGPTIAAEFRRPVVTDEMVARAVLAFHRSEGETEDGHALAHKNMRAALSAALGVQGTENTDPENRSQ